MSAIKNTTNVPTDASASQRVTFSQELRDLAERFAERPARFGEILDATKGRGFHLLLVLIALPFLTPIPLPGFSVPFGLAVAVIGARMALGQRPWLPQKLLERELPPGFLLKVLDTAGRALKILERFLRLIGALSCAPIAGALQQRASRVDCIIAISGGAGARRPLFYRRLRHVPGRNDLLHSACPRRRANLGLHPPSDPRRLTYSNPNKPRTGRLSPKSG